MTVTVRSKTPLTVPPSVRRGAGIKTGDRVEECAPAQRRRIDARLAESEADLKRGRPHGPFATHEDIMAFLKDHLAKQRRPARNPRARG
jgi:bifunctional DNA-binding transcriptional regulator/antitoxin component of YhaV-PrlF toxin-antitoxin module